MKGIKANLLACCEAGEMLIWGCTSWYSKGAVNVGDFSSICGGIGNGRHWLIAWLRNWYLFFSGFPVLKKVNYTEKPKNFGRGFGVVSKKGSCGVTPFETRDLDEKRALFSHTKHLHRSWFCLPLAKKSYMLLPVTMV